MRWDLFRSLAIGVVAVSVSVGLVGAPSRGGPTTTSTAAASNWAQGLFDERQHDFGPVPRGSVVHHDFVLTNRTSAPVTILSLRVSCGCTSGKAETNVVPPGGSGRIEATMDTRNFVGRKATTLYVMLHNGYGETEVALNVVSTILSDIVLNPGGIDLGAATRGQTPASSLTIDRLGRPEWRVTRMVSTSKAILANLTEIRRDASGVGYRLDVSLRPDAPAGLVRDEIQVETNDPESRAIPISVTAEVRGELTATPSVLTLAASPGGEPTRARVIVRASRPFKVVGVEGISDGYSTSVDSAEARPLHVLTIAFAAKPGAAVPAGARPLKILTDLPGEAPALITATLQGRP